MTGQPNISEFLKGFQQERDTSSEGIQALFQGTRFKIYCLICGRSEVSISMEDGDIWSAGVSVGEITITCDSCNGKETIQI